VQFLKGGLGSCLVAAMVWSWLSAAGAAQERIVIVGSGSNVPVHLYQAWTREFNAANERVQVRYLPLGTSQSVRQISQGIGDFGGGEILLTDAEMHGSKISLLAIPVVLVGLVPIYNLPGNPELNFSGDLLAQIYLGIVKNWKDPRIVKLNPKVELPDLPIRVVHRSPGKGSNYIFTAFLSKTSSQFRTEVGKSPSPHWPLGIGGRSWSRHGGKGCRDAGLHRLCGPEFCPQLGSRLWPGRKRHRPFRAGHTGGN